MPGAKVCVFHRTSWPNTHSRDTKSTFERKAPATNALLTVSWGGRSRYFVRTTRVLPSTISEWQRVASVNKSLLQTKRTKSKDRSATKQRDSADIYTTWKTNWKYNEGKWSGSLVDLITTERKVQGMSPLINVMQISIFIFWKNWIEENKRLFSSSQIAL